MTSRRSRREERRRAFGWIVFVLVLTASTVELYWNHYPQAIYLVLFAHVARTANHEPL